jgi:hypothetical protein
MSKLNLLLGLILGLLVIATMWQNPKGRLVAKNLNQNASPHMERAIQLARKYNVPDKYIYLIEAELSAASNPVPEIPSELMVEIYSEDVKSE